MITAYLCLRRVNGGKRINADKQYMVYIVQSNQSPHNYDHWLCGGALISDRQVLTAASCLTEMTHVYVIAGYRKYVNGRAVELDVCTRTRKNRVIKTCVPKKYNLSYSDQSQWISIDVGVAIVENPYNFSDKTWQRYCSYTPKPIRVSFDTVRPGLDVVSFGWGGSYWRTPTDVLDNNSLYLQEMVSVIVHKRKCKEDYDREEVKLVIEKFMICVEGYGNIDGDGVMLDTGPKTRQGCRRSENNSGCRYDSGSQNKSNVILLPPVPSRRQSLCQNDHGGPLTTWIGTEEVIIGVACTSIVDADTLMCTSPSIFTSTYCTGKTIECLMAMTPSSRRRCAEEIEVDGIGIQDSDINWSKQSDDTEYEASCCQRRLSGGKQTEIDKRYMVYIVQSNQSSKNLDNWLCGGALISPWQVLTAASCLMETTHLYVIAGYRKYINGRAIEYNDCTRTKKNRVMKTCVPKGFILQYSNRSRWMTFDIGVAFVEKRYSLNDQSWLDHCSYIPKPIPISYNKFLSLVGTDVVAFGWGAANLRIQTDILDNNSLYLQEIASLVAEKNVCKESFSGVNVKSAIDMYMICVSGIGNIDSAGIMRNLGSVANSGCGRRSGNGSGCDRNDNDTRRKSGARRPPVPSRRQALCQNDHGGPLVTWLGSEEVLIGVACTSIVDVRTLVCTSPSIFTSTHCTGKILECLTAMTKASRRRCSEEMKSAGIEIHDNDIDWDKEFDENLYADSELNDSTEAAYT